MNDSLLLKEIDLLKDERNRRSNNQFQYIRLNLVNIGVMFISAFLFKKDAFQTIDANFYISFISILSLLSLTLFLMWVDDAFTIAGIDKFFQYCEEKYNIYGWYAFRKETLNSTKTFKFKSYIFNVAVLMSFVFPPMIAALLLFVANINIYVTDAFFASILLLLFTLFYNWRRFSKDIYVETKSKLLK